MWLVTGPSANAIATALRNAGYEAEAADHELAVKILGADGNELCIVWIPLGEPTPTGLGHVYLWGRTGDEHQAPDYTGVGDLVRAIARTLQ